MREVGVRTADLPLAVPASLRISYDDALPVSARRAEIAEAIRGHQVVILAGETGSGKTTQLPKICLELGRRSIAHTQPRRIAARSVAERVAEELGVGLGDLVGYQVRFTRRASAATRLKIMTDGVLLAEIGRDRDLRRYDTIIIDEAHERSLNIDFLLGYLRQLSARRPELKIIITSATIDTDRFAAHFADANGLSAPIVQVSGRTYPVEVRYRPISVDGEADQIEGVTAAVKELSAIGGGDILAFFSGEREIRDAAEAIQGLKLRDTEVLPLYARLSAAEQHRVFTSHPGRRVVLATNVAETSLTVPGIRYVIDTGTARISRYSARTKVQRLPIEPISRASADQRAGRCGRLGPGVCIRLYEEEDLAGRPEFTEPEILRTNLASVILQMTAADLGEVSSFPFVEAPDSTQIADGLRLLDELGALVPQPSSTHHRVRLTTVGRRLAALPIDPRMGRMLLAGERQGCLREMLVVVSGLSIQDPRERPAEQRDAADARHRRFWAVAPTDGQESTPDGSDFLALLRLWDYLQEEQRRRSGNGFRRMCREEFLHFLRIREWQDLHTQLRGIVRDLGLGVNESPAAADRVHAAVLSGLLSHVGLAEVSADPKQTEGRRRARTGPREYLGARGSRFAINPGSSVAKVQPPLVMAAEIVETTRLWARTVAGITAAQVEEVGQHLLKRSYSEPHWSTRAQSVMAYETVSLYGVPVVARRRIAYGSVNPGEAREIFIRSALVEGQWSTRHPFFARNAAVRVEAESLEERRRRRDLVVDDQAIVDFYSSRIPAEVVSGAHFDRWWKLTRQHRPDLLDLTLQDLMVAEGQLAPGDAFPDVWRVGDHDLQLSYRFDPRDPRDGVSVEIPIALLNQLDGTPFSWQVPGFRSELAAELIRSLPKATRRSFVPAPEFAERSLTWLRGHPGPAGESLPGALGRALRLTTGELVPATAWALDDVPSHLRVTFVVTDGEVLAEGKDLEELRSELAGRVSETLADAAAEHTRTQMTTWDLTELPAQVEITQNGHRIVGYPALADEGATAGVRVAESAARQHTLHRRGLRRLVMLNTPDPTRWVVAHLGNADKLVLGASPYASVPALLADARLASVGELITRSGLDARDPGSFVRLCDVVRADNPDQMRALVRLAAEVLRAHQAAAQSLPRVQTLSEAAHHDISEQLGNLVFAGFLAATPYARLLEVPRYLTAVGLRITALVANPDRDAAGLATMSRCEDAYAALVDRAPPGPLPQPVDDVGWLLEELRVSLFAQSLRTRVPVSEKRVRTAISAAEAGL